MIEACAPVKNMSDEVSQAKAELMQLFGAQGAFAYLASFRNRLQLDAVDLPARPEASVREVARDDRPSRARDLLVAARMIQVHVRVDEVPDDLRWSGDAFDLGHHRVVAVGQLVGVSREPPDRSVHHGRVQCVRTYGRRKPRRAKLA